MAQISLCNNKYQVESSNLIDPLDSEQIATIELDQLPIMVDDCFASPIDFPSIHDAIVPGDTIAIAVAPDTPCGMEIARVVEARFVKYGIEPDRIQIVCLDGTLARGDDDTGVQIHDPADEQNLAYLLVDKEGHPWYVNRTLFEADVVVPIGDCDARQLEDSIFPWFMDSSTQKIAKRLPSTEFRAAARMVSSNLGIFWQIRLVTAPGGQLVKLLCGETDSVSRAAEKMGRDVWGVRLHDFADLVIATIEPAACQNWKNVGRAILNADMAVSENGAILLCTDLSRRPPGNWPASKTRAGKKNNELTEIFSRRHIFLASRLTEESTEQIGFGHVGDSAQFQRLMDQYKSCLLLRDAHKVGLQNTQIPQTTQKTNQI